LILEASDRVELRRLRRSAADARGVAIGVAIHVAAQLLQIPLFIISPLIVLSLRLDPHASMIALVRAIPWILSAVIAVTLGLMLCQRRPAISAAMGLTAIISAWGAADWIRARILISDGLQASAMAELVRAVFFHCLCSTTLGIALIISTDKLGLDRIAKFFRMLLEISLWAGGAAATVLFVLFDGMPRDAVGSAVGIISWCLWLMSLVGMTVLVACILGGQRRFTGNSLG
jgi:hypothetical protein